MIRVFFDSPGVGKSTLCCKLAKKALKNEKRYKAAYINFKNLVPGCYSCDVADLGNWTFQKYSYIALDEAGIEFNNRAYKSMPKPTIAWLKKHRHYSCDVDVFSQSWEDMDVTIRRLATELWYMYRIGPFTLCRKVYKRVMVDKNTHQIIDGYRMPSMLWLLIWPLQLGYPFQKKFMLTFRPFYYRYFNSWECDDLPVKDFQRYTLSPVPFPIVEKINSAIRRLRERATGLYTGASETLKRKTSDLSQILRRIRKKVE